MLIRYQNCYFFPLYFPYVSKMIIILEPFFFIFKILSYLILNICCSWLSVAIRVAVA